MNFGLRGKIALVTASSKGIGKAAAEGLAGEGCKVIICSRSKDDLITASDEINSKYNSDVSWCVCDLNKLKDIEETYRIVKDQYGAIDILVNNCGGPAAGVFNELNEKNWQAAFEQVLMSVVRFCNLVVPDMIIKEWGRIINITSVAVKQPIENLMLSNSLRSGVIGFAKSLSNELAKYKITVNNIAPGYTLTNRIYDLAVNKAKQSGKSHEEIITEFAKDIPMNRMALPEEIAAPVSFLASRQASYITGNTIHVDGGWVKGLL
jgi:3-oxoacyl-[acyl-carrier protein] reductase